MQTFYVTRGMAMHTVKAKTQKQAREFLANAPECFNPVLKIPANANVTYRSYENGERCESFATVTAEVEITFKRTKKAGG